MMRQLPIGLASLLGLVLFFWPFVGRGLPADTPAWGVALAAAGGAGHWRRGVSTPTWRDLVTLAVIGALMGWAYGALMDIQDWIGYYRGNPSLGWLPGMAAATSWLHFARFYLVTSLAYDTFRS